MKKTLAYGTIAAAQVSAIADIANEGQARELAPMLAKMETSLAETTIKEIVAEAQAEGPVTAAVLRVKVKAAMPPKPKPKPKPKLADFNKKIDEGVIPTVKTIKAFKVAESDWYTYSHMRLTRHIEAMVAARDALDILIVQAQAHLGSVPSK